MRIVKSASLFAMAIYMSIAFDDAGKVSRPYAETVAMQVAEHITTQLSTGDGNDYRNQPN
jgi:hypothetical protein